MINVCREPFSLLIIYQQRITMHCEVLSKSLENVKFRSVENRGICLNSYFKEPVVSGSMSVSYCTEVLEERMQIKFHNALQSHILLSI